MSTSRLLKAGRGSALVLLCTGFATAATIRVPGDYLKIQRGIDDAVDGDTVLVSPGMYVESLSFKGKAIRLRSVWGPDSTILEPAAARLPAVLFESGEDTMSVLEGFHIRAARDTVAIMCDGSGPIIQDCEISDCINDWVGAAIKCDFWAKPIIRYNDIHHNESLIGAAVYVNGYSTVEIAYNIIHHNTGARPGLGISQGLAYIHHNVLHDNIGTGPYWWIDAAIWLQGSAHRVINNTLVRNTVGIYCNRGVSTVINNIVVSGGDGISDHGDMLVDYNNVWNNAYSNEPGIHGITMNPLFIDSLADLRLSPGSPCVNLGHPDPMYNDPDGTRNDMGAYPLAGSPPTVSTPLAPAHDSILPTLYPVFVWTESLDPDPGDWVMYDLEVSSDILTGWSTLAESLQTARFEDSIVLEQGHRYSWRVVSHDRLGWATPSMAAGFRTYLAGDANGSLHISTADVLELVNFCYKGGSFAAPVCAADVDATGVVGPMDLIILVNYVFKDGPAPVAGCDR